MPRFLFVLSCLLGTLLSSCAYEKTEDLIAPQVVCNTPAIVTYRLSIVPLLQRNCYSCHNAVLATDNVNLEDFTVLKKHINSGELMGNVKHLPGFHPMPDGGAKLSDCDIALLQSWVDAGALNN